MTSNTRWEGMMSKVSSLLHNEGGGDEEAAVLPETSSTPSLLERARDAAGLRPSVREELIESACPKLSFKQRLYGFLICFTIGLVITISSMFSYSFTRLLTGDPEPFAIRYTTGNIISLVSTSFIVGPARQLKQMTAPSRWLTALVYVGAIGMTLVSALVLHSASLVLACITVQGLAMMWYMLSYIPFARRAVRSCFKSAVFG